MPVLRCSPQARNTLRSTHRSAPQPLSPGTQPQTTRRRSFVAQEAEEPNAASGHDNLLYGFTGSALTSKNIILKAEHCGACFPIVHDYMLRRSSRHWQLAHPGWAWQSEDALR